MDYVSSFVETTEKLAELDIKLSDDLKVIMLLTNLPNSFENFVVAIETRDKLPDFETIRLKLLEEGVRKEEKDVQENSSQAVYAHTHHKSYEQRRTDGRATVATAAARTNNKKDDKKFQGKCFVCKKSGHRASECRNKKKDKKVKAEHTNNCVMHVSTDKYSTKPNVWCVDSGATSHMCGVRDLFENLTEKKSKVTLATDTSTEATGVGTV